MTDDKKLSLNEALEMLSIGEIATIERHFGKEFGNDLFAFTEMTPGAIYCLERRKALAENGAKLPTWDDVMAMTTKQIQAYFAPDEIEIDPTEPGTDQGKDDSLAA